MESKYLISSPLVVSLSPIPTHRITLCLQENTEIHISSYPSPSQFPAEPIPPTTQGISCYLQKNQDKSQGYPLHKC